MTKQYDFKAGDKVVLRKDAMKRRGRNTAFAFDQLMAEFIAGTHFTVREDYRRGSGWLAVKWTSPDGRQHCNVYDPCQFEPASPTQSVAELKAENESLMRQIESMEKRIAKKRKFHAENEEAIKLRTPTPVVIYVRKQAGRIGWNKAGRMDYLKGTEVTAVSRYGSAGVYVENTTSDTKPRYWSLLSEDFVVVEGHVSTLPEGYPQ